MKTVLSLAFVLFLAAPACGQDETISTGTVTAVQSRAKQASKRKAVSVQKEYGKSAPIGIKTEKNEPARGAQSEEEGAVIIDTRGDEDYVGRFSDNEPSTAEPEEPVVPGGMPASYGQLKGTLNDGGRNLLVFENEEGSVSFVQIFMGKAAVSWKLISRIYRSAD
ncbi:MAG: hypothetical protein WCK75_04940 [Elusimicrobiota bacterium]